MNRTGAIILVDDDSDECMLIEEAFRQLEVRNKIICFSNGAEALHYLKTTTDQPFIILSDVNMPAMNGLELRRQINADERLRKKSIPFVFLSTTASPAAIQEAYEMSVQGFFEKPMVMTQILDLLREIYHYWQRCKHPNN